MAFQFAPTTSVSPQSFSAPQSAQMGATVDANPLSALGAITNINATQQNTAASRLATQKARETYGADVAKAQAESDQAVTGAKSAAVKLGNEQMNTMYTALVPFATDKRVLAAEELTPESTPEQIKEVQNGLFDVSDQVKKELRAKGWSHADIAQYSHPFEASILQDARKAPNEIKMATQKLAGALNIAEQNQPRFEKNAAGEFVQVTPARKQVTNVGGGSANPNPTTGGVSSTTEYIKDLGSRVQSGILMDIKLNEAEQLLGQFKAGAGTKAYQDMAQRLQAIGAPQDLVDKVAGGDLSAVQSVNKFIAQAVTQGAAQAGGGGTTANILNEYVKNNPDVNNDPRALKRFIEFAKKQNELAYKENEFLLKQKQGGKFNPETHIQEMQQHLREQYLGPQKKEATSEKPKENEKKPEAKTGKTIVSVGKDANGVVKAVKYSDGSIEYK